MSKILNFHFLLRCFADEQPHMVVVENKSGIIGIKTTVFTTNQMVFNMYGYKMQINVRYFTYIFGLPQAI